MKIFASPYMRALVAVIIGALLIEFGEQTIKWLLIVIPVLGSANQFIRLVLANRWATIQIGYWITPIVLLLTGLVAGLIAMLRPDLIAEIEYQYMLLGWMLLIYGIVECINTMKISTCRRRLEAEKQAQAELLANASEAIVE